MAAPAHRDAVGREGRQSRQFAYIRRLGCRVGVEEDQHVADGGGGSEIADGRQPESRIVLAHETHAVRDGRNLG